MTSQIKIRDRQITERRLIAAVGSLLAKDGFKALGVNALAREAGVDKKLIYRYFDGLAGLIRAYGEAGDFWPSALELAGGDIRAFGSLPLQERLSAFARHYIQGLQSRPMALQIMAWEMVERNELTQVLEEVREQGILEFFKMFFAPEDKDGQLQKGIMLVGAAVSYLLIRSRQIDVYGGMELKTEEDWQQIQETIETMTRAMVP